MSMAEEKEWRRPLRRLWEARGFENLHESPGDVREGWAKELYKNRTDRIQ